MAGNMTQWVQAFVTKFYPQNQHDSRKEVTPPNCPLTSTTDECIGFPWSCCYKGLWAARCSCWEVHSGPLKNNYCSTEMYPALRNMVFIQKVIVSQVIILATFLVIWVSLIDTTWSRKETSTHTSYGELEWTLVYKAY